MSDPSGWISAFLPKTTRDWLATLTALAAGVTFVAWLASFGTNEDLRTQLVSEARATLLREELQHGQRQFEQRVEMLLAEIRKASSKGENGLALAVAQTTQQAANVDKRLAGLEQSLTTSPEKALAIPMLRKDLDAFREQHQRDVEAIASDVGRIYDMNKWVLGFMATAIVGLSLNNLFGKKS